MGEYQNKAVTLMTACLGEQSATDPKERGEAFLTASIGLFYALGLSVEDLAKTAKAATAKPTPPVDVAIGDLMKEMAAIGTMHDLDIMQAAYNTLDQQMQSLKKTLDVTSKRIGQR